MVQIIPRQEEQRPLWIDILFFLSLAILACSLGFFVFLQNAQQRLQKEITQVKESLSKDLSNEFISLETNLKETKGKVENFTTLFKGRENPLIALETIESTAHPQTFFTTMSMDMKTHEVQLGGIAQTFQAVEEQLIIFRTTPGITSVQLVNLGLSLQGQISYHVRFFLIQEPILQP